MVPPDPEIPTRIVKQLVSLSTGIAMVREKVVVTPEEIRLVSKVGLDSIPPMRLKLLRCLTEAFPNPMKAEKIASMFRVGNSTIYRWLDDLYVLGILNKSKRDDSPLTPYDWRLIDKYGNLLKDMEDG